MSIFTPYSTRSAATSKVATNIQTSTILRTAGWSNEKTFARFYKKKIVKEGVFAKAVLRSSRDQAGMAGQGWFVCFFVCCATSLKNLCYESFFHNVSFLYL